MSGDRHTTEIDLRAAYLWLLKQCLTNMIYRDDRVAHADGDRIWPFDLESRRTGRDWPLKAHTMIGLERLAHLQSCVEAILADNVPGDLIEAGVWRGGASILIRGILKAHGVTDRVVWLADSFRGLPPPDVEKYPMDAGLDLSDVPHLAVSLAEVRENFARYDLLDDRVRFLEGLFRDTLPGAQITRLALMRLDGDLYESTMDALTALYPRLSIGGYVIIDDYGAVPQAAQAVGAFRERYGVTEELLFPDWTSAVWRRAT